MVKGYFKVFRAFNSNGLRYMQIEEVSTYLRHPEVPGSMRWTYKEDGTC